MLVCGSGFGVKRTFFYDGISNKLQYTSHDIVDSGADSLRHTVVGLSSACHQHLQTSAAI